MQLVSELFTNTKQSCPTLWQWRQHWQLSRSQVTVANLHIDLCMHSFHFSFPFWPKKYNNVDTLIHVPWCGMCFNAFPISLLIYFTSYFSYLLSPYHLFFPSFLSIISFHLCILFFLYLSLLIAVGAGWHYRLIWFTLCCSGIWKRPLERQVLHWPRWCYIGRRRSCVSSETCESKTFDFPEIHKKNWREE